MSNEFENDPAWGRDRYTYRDSDGDEMQIEAAEAPKDGEDILIHIRDLDGATTSVWANARELIAAAQKAGNLDLTIVNNAVYREYFGGNPGSETPIGTMSGDGIRLEPDPSVKEDLFTLLVELYAELKLAGASKETLALVVKRIRRQVMQEQVLRTVA